MAKLVTLKNDFHGSSVTLRLDIEGDEQYLTALLSPHQTRKARRSLCPSKDCRCAQSCAGTRGTQTVDGKPLHIRCPQFA